MPEGEDILGAEPSGISESHLVMRAQAGDQMAFERLYEQYNDRICFYLSRMVGNDGIACELAQDTFLTAWESLLSLRDPLRFKSWLYRIATNKAHNQQKRINRFPMIPWELQTGRGEEPSTEGPEDMIEETELLKLALARVSLTYRSCLILYVIEDLPQKHIAELLDIKECNVSKYISRGKEELRQIYLRLTGESNATREKS